MVNADQNTPQRKEFPLSKNILAIVVLVLIALAMLFGWTFLYGPDAHYQLTKEKTTKPTPIPTSSPTPLPAWYPANYPTGTLSNP